MGTDDDEARSGSAPGSGYAAAGELLTLEDGKAASSNGTMQRRGSALQRKGSVVGKRTSHGILLQRTPY